MTNILTYDVPTYVRDLISNESGPVNNEKKAHSDAPSNLKNCKSKAINCR